MFVSGVASTGISVLSLASELVAENQGPQPGVGRESDLQKAVSYSMLLHIPTWRWMPAGSAAYIPDLIGCCFFDNFLPRSSIGTPRAQQFDPTADRQGRRAGCGSAAKQSRSENFGRLLRRYCQRPDSWYAKGLALPSSSGNTLERRDLAALSDEHWRRHPIGWFTHWFTPVETALDAANSGCYDRRRAPPGVCRPSPGQPAGPEYCAGVSPDSARTDRCRG